MFAIHKVRVSKALTNPSDSIDFTMSLHIIDCLSVKYSPFFGSPEKGDGGMSKWDCSLRSVMIPFMGSGNAKANPRVPGGFDQYALAWCDKDGIMTSLRSVMIPIMGSGNAKANPRLPGGFV